MEPLVFEFDPAKSIANLYKHGIDFVDAQDLWNDERLIELDAARIEEPRRIVIGMFAEKHWFAVFTMRGAAIRLISVRRARVKEVQLYEGQ